MDVFGRCEPTPFYNMFLKTLLVNLGSSLPYGAVFVPVKCLSFRVD